MRVGVSTGLINILTACMVSVPTMSWVNLTRKKSFPLLKSVAGVYVQSPVVVIATVAPFYSGFHCLIIFIDNFKCSITPSVLKLPVIFAGLVEIYFAVPPYCHR